MSVADVAKYLRVNESAVRRLIAKGDIPSFDVAGEPRVQYGALVQWFQSAAQSRSLEILRQELDKPLRWRDALNSNPDARDNILSSEHEEGTFGAFLKEAAFAEDESEPGNQQDAINSSVLQQNENESSSGDSGKTRHNDPHEYLRNIYRRPFITVLVAIGLVVVALGAFTEALQKIFEFIQGLINAFLH